jgi:hypothetical protein
MIHMSMLIVKIYTSMCYQDVNRKIALAFGKIKGYGYNIHVADDPQPSS